MPAYEHKLRVRFQHTGPAGIVFFANILVYCHEAYVTATPPRRTPVAAIPPPG